MSVPGTKGSLRNGELSPGSRNERLSSSFYSPESRWVPWSCSQALTGRSLERLFSTAVVLTWAQWPARTDWFSVVSGEPVWLSSDSWKGTGTPTVPVPLPVDGCWWHMSLPVPTPAHMGGPGDPSSGWAGPTSPSSPAHLLTLCWPPSLHRVRGTSIRWVKIQPVYIWP